MLGCCVISSSDPSLHLCVTFASCVVGCGAQKRLIWVGFWGGRGPPPDRPDGGFSFLISCHQCAAFKWSDGPLMCAEERLGLSGPLVPIIVKPPHPPENRKS